MLIIALLPNAAVAPRLHVGVTPSILRFIAHHINGDAARPIVMQIKDLLRLQKSVQEGAKLLKVIEDRVMNQNACQAMACSLAFSKAKLKIIQSSEALCLSIDRKPVDAGHSYANPIRQVDWVDADVVISMLMKKEFMGLHDLARARAILEVIKAFNH